jgi:hypothetical protein
VPPSIVTTSTTMGCRAEGLSHEPGVDHGLKDVLCDQHDHQQDERLGEPATAKRDDEREGSGDDRAEERDVAGDEGHQPDRERERDPEEPGALRL